MKSPGNAPNLTLHTVKSLYQANAVNKISKESSRKIKQLIEQVCKTGISSSILTSFSQ